MDRTMVEFSMMAITATAVSAIVLLISLFIFDDVQTKEYCGYLSILIGTVVGLILLYLLRRRDIFMMGDKVLCEKLRDISSVLSFLTPAPVVMSLILRIGFQDVPSEDMIVIAAILVIVSMLVQAVFWKYAQDIGSLTFLNIAMLVLSLIIMNISALLCYDNGSEGLMVIGTVIAIMPILMMYDWMWTVSLVFKVMLVCAVCGTILVVLQDLMFFGIMLSFWIPVVFIFLIGFKLKGAFLMNDGKKLF